MPTVLPHHQHTRFTAGAGTQIQKGTCTCTRTHETCANLCEPRTSAPVHLSTTPLAPVTPPRCEQRSCRGKLPLQPIAGPCNVQWGAKNHANGNQGPTKEQGMGGGSRCEGGGPNLPARNHNNNGTRGAPDCARGWMRGSAAVGMHVARVSSRLTAHRVGAGTWGEGKGGGKGRGLPYPSAGTEYAAVPGMFAIASELPPTPGDVHCPS